MIENNLFAKVALGSVQSNKKTVVKEIEAFLFQQIPIQSEFARKWLLDHGLPTDLLDKANLKLVLSYLVDKYDYRDSTIFTKFYSLSKIDEDDKPIEDHYCLAMAISILLGEELVSRFSNLTWKISSKAEIQLYVTDTRLKEYYAFVSPRSFLYGMENYINGNPLAEVSLEIESDYITPVIEIQKQLDLVDTKKLEKRKHLKRMNGNFIKVIPENELIGLSWTQENSQHLKVQHNGWFEYPESIVVETNPAFLDPETQKEFENEDEKFKVKIFIHLSDYKKINQKLLNNGYSHLISKVLTLEEIKNFTIIGEDEEHPVSFSNPATISIYVDYLGEAREIHLIFKPFL